ncbi:MAG: DUF2017 family protein [Planctomycetes bacterium]|nr:DUF2017 family protein [Planctomycetota bacterium]
MFIAVRRRDNEDFVLEMSPPLFQFLHLLPDRLREVLDSPDFTSRALQRLFPPAYSDPDRETEYRQLIAGDLLAQRMAKIEAFEQILARGEIAELGARIVVPASQFDATLSFLNDLRVVLAEELEIEDEDWEARLQPNDPRADQILMLHLLGSLEQGLLEATGMVDFEIDPDDVSR